MKGQFLVTADRDAKMKLMYMTGQVATSVCLDSAPLCHHVIRPE